MIRLERTGDLFSLLVARKGESFETAGSLTVALGEDIHAGLVVCSHDATTRETAILREVSLETIGPGPRGPRGGDPGRGRGPAEPARPKLGSRAGDHFVAPTGLRTAPGLDDGPDYTPDGKQIYFNSVRTGLMKIWRMNADGSQQEQVTTDTEYADWFPHPSPDGKWLVFLSYDKSVSGHPADQDV